MKTKITLGIALVAVVIAAMALLRASQVVRVSSVAGLNSVGTFQSINGLRTEYRSQAFGVGTTTPCVFRAPTDATSTLVYASLNISNASSTATTWTVGKDIATTLTSDGVFATTTVISGPFTLGSGAQGTLVASTTPVNGGTIPVVDSNVTFAPGEFLVWGVSGLTYTALSSSEMGGVCKAVFRVDSTEN